MLRQALFAGIVKFLSAGLSYVLFAVIALASDGYQFGVFGVAFGAASLAAFLVLGGQNTVAFKVWPKYSVRNRVATASAFIRYGAGLYLAFSACVTALSSAYYFLSWKVGWPTPGGYLWFSFIALTLMLSLAEYISALLRVRGALGWALVPRDIVWRGLAILAFTLLWGFGFSVGAASAIAIMAVLLALVVLVQIFLSRDRLIFQSGYHLKAIHKQYHHNISAHLCASALLQQASIHLSVVLVGILIDPVSAGAFFAADKTGRLVSLGLTGFTQALGPQISRLYHMGKPGRRRLQALMGKISLGSVLFGASTSVFFYFYGIKLLALFDPSYASREFLTVLLILAGGQTLVAYFGCAPLFIQLAGEHKAYTRITLFSNAASLVLMLILVGPFGVVGAALAAIFNSLTLAALSSIHCRRKMSLNTGLRLLPVD